MIPLSEDDQLHLNSPRELMVLPGEVKNWNESTSIGRGEKRAISLEIRVGSGGKGEMTRIFYVPQGARLTIYHTVTVEAGGEWQNVICVRGGGEVKIRRALKLSGAGAKASFMCLGVMEQMGRMSVADEMFLSAPKTQASLSTKIVLNHEAQSEARGRIVIENSAPGSEAFEKLDHLVLGERATVVAIPELEVKTDDVKCGHGATTSRPSEAELFYLTSRGLSLLEAEALVAQGFIASALVDFPEDVRNEVGRMLFS